MEMIIHTTVLYFLLSSILLYVVALTPDELTKKVEQLERKEVQQDHAINVLQRKTPRNSAFCKLLRTDICGPCACYDDYGLRERYYCDCQDLKPKRDCLEFYESGIRISGIYKVTMNNLKLMQVYCDQKTDGGGWTVFQRRVDGSTNFYRNWNEYKEGFGEYQKEFYLGNEHIYVLTLQALYPKGSQLRIDMTDWDDKKKYAKYKFFQLGNERTKYTMHLSGYSGNAGDSLTSHTAMKFSTYDRDNDAHGSNHCAQYSRGAWWYNRCTRSNLNGEYRLPYDSPGNGRGILWYDYKSTAYSLKQTEMKVRRNR